jgi:hypothetical protein
MDSPDRFEPEKHFSRGEQFVKEGKYVWALHEYTMAIQQKKLYPEAYRRRSEAKLWLGDDLGARADMELAEAAASIAKK